MLRLLPAVLLTAVSASAQVRASERGSVSQTVDGTTITIDYARPQARGRDSLFGGIVAWGRTWTGANWATTFTTNKPVTVGGVRVPAGTWGLWWTLRADTAWTLIFDPEPHRFHLMPPDSSAAQIRAELRPGTGPHTELLTWSFDVVRPTGTTLRFAWGTTTVAIPIQVQPSQDFAVSAEFAERFVGTWTMETSGMLAGRDMSLELFYADGKLQGRWTGAPNPRLQVIWMASRGAGVFWPGETEDGEMVDLLADVVFEFTPLAGRATRFEMRGLGDNLWAVGTRRP